MEQAADKVLRVLRQRSTGVAELFRTTNAVPGLAVIADAATVGELAGSPDVHSVRNLVPKTAMNSNAVTRTLRAWQQTGRLGDGVRIGIIDDGIDYTHADFGGPGTRAAYAAIDRTMVKPSYFPTRKVVGGYDFAGDDYDGGVTAGPLGIIPRPDPNPLSCGEHGNHVAGTAAGFGVNGDGTTFGGNYQNLDPAALNALRIGPGTAPHAQLYALKVFGCHGATGLVAKAMDWAVQVLPVNGQYGDVDSGVFDSNVIVLPVSLAALGIDPSAVTAPISYTTGVASYYPGPVNVGRVIDSTGPALFDAVRPGLWAQGVGDPALSYLARPGTALMVNRDTTAAVAQRATRLLVLHPSNPSRHRVQLVPVSAPGSGPVGGPAVPIPVPAAPPAPPAPPAPVAPADRARGVGRPAGPRYFGP